MDEKWKDIGVRIAIVAGFVLAIIFIITLTTKSASAYTTTDENSYGEVWGNSFTAYAKWTFVASDTIDLKLLLNDDQVAKSYDSGSYSGESGWDYVRHSPVEDGKYTLQLWSRSQNTMIYSRSWTVPSLTIKMDVSPMNTDGDRIGTIGTTFIATLRFSTTSTPPDYYAFSGLMELNIAKNAGRHELNMDPIVFKQDIDNTVIVSKHYFEYIGKTETDYSNLLGAYITFGVTLPSKGNYTINAKFTEGATDFGANANPIWVDVVDQYQPQLDLLNGQLTICWKELNDTKAQLNTTMKGLDMANSNATASNDKIQDLEKKLDSTRTLAFDGIAIGAIGLILAIIGLVGFPMIKKMRERKNKDPSAQQIPQAQDNPPQVPPIPPQK